ncbi:hypothetical protein ABI59_13180 [Acidobacteria bacterium Mor1]|nr:hypothetical protein ABI59_13180 [Acidobacteria bacterium Mor1]
MSDKRQELLDGLNEDLANEWAAIQMYRSYASMVKGPYRKELREFFEAEIPEELTHAGLLTDKIVALGGVPTTRVAPVEMVDDAKQMLEQALVAERDTITRYVQRRRQAEDLEQFGLAIELDTLIADEAKHHDELKLMLDKWD